MDCKEIKECYSDYIEDASVEVRSLVEEHVAECSKCREGLKNFGVMLTRLRSLPEASVPPDFIVKVNRKIDSMEHRGVVKEVWQSFFAVGGWSKALAMAATFVLIILGAFYFQEQPIDKTVTHSTEMARISDESGKDLVAKPSTPAQPVVLPVPSGPRTILRDYGIQDPVSPVGYRSGGVSPATSSNPLSEEVAYPADRNQPFAAFSIPPPSRSKAAYPDHIVLIKVDNQSEATEQVRNLVESLNGKFLAYGSDVTFAQIPFELQDQFLMALDSLGKVTVINGPIERTDAHYFLVEVIAISANQ